MMLLLSLSAFAWLLVMTSRYCRPRPGTILYPCPGVIRKTMSRTV